MRPKGYIHGETFYPLGDRYPGQNQKTPVVAQWTGEFRAPKKDEWYLSGDPVDAYKAPNNLSTKYFIAKLVRIHYKKCIIEEL